MRILIAIDHWGLIGGSERYAAAIARALLARGHEVRAVAGAASGEPLGDVPCDIVPGYSEERGDVEPLRRAAAKAPFDVVYVLSIRSTRAWTALLDLGKPVVRFVQDHTLFCPGLNKVYEDGATCSKPLGMECLRQYYLHQGCIGFKKKLHRQPWRDGFGGVWKHLTGVRLARRGHSLVVASHYMRVELERAGFEPARVHVLPYFTDSGQKAPDDRAIPRELRERLDGTKLPLVLTPTRLVLPDKGVDYLITALTKVKEKCLAVIAGSGPAEGYLREKAKAEGLAERAHFTGWMGPEALEALYARANVVAFPSMWNEPFGLVGLEAMSHRKPLVAFDVGGVPEWLENGVNGLLVPRGDTERFAGAIDALLADPARGAAMGVAGQKKQREQFSRSAHIEGLDALLKKAAG